MGKDMKILLAKVDEWLLVVRLIMASRRPVNARPESLQNSSY